MTVTVQCARGGDKRNIRLGLCMAEHWLTCESLKALVAVNDGVVGQVGVRNNDRFTSAGQRLITEMHRLNCIPAARDIHHHPCKVCITHRSICVSLSRGAVTGFPPR